MKLRDTELIDEEIVLDDPKVRTFFGPNLTLTNCHIITKVTSRALGFGDVTFNNCKFTTKKKLGRISWCGVKLFNTEFQGHLDGHDFGYWPVLSEFGELHSCDFSKAKLDGCRFFSCKMNRVILPKWPIFSIHNPLESAKEMAKSNPEGMLVVLPQTYSQMPAETKVVTGYAKGFCKTLGVEEDELKNYLSQFDFVEM